MRTNDFTGVSDKASVGAHIEQFDAVRLSTLWVCEKWSEDAADYGRKMLGKLTGLSFDKGCGVSSALLRALKIEPDLGIVEVPGNLALNEGLQMMLDLMIGTAGTVYSNANARIGVGDSTTAEAATQTDLQAAVNKLYKGMNATYPSRASQTLSFQADFLTAEANWVWNEWTVDNGAASAKNINRKVQSLGTKVSGTWTLTGTVAAA